MPTERTSIQTLREEKRPSLTSLGFGFWGEEGDNILRPLQWSADVCTLAMSLAVALLFVLVGTLGVPPASPPRSHGNGGALQCPHPHPGPHG